MTPQATPALRGLRLLARGAVLLLTTGALSGCVTGAARRSAPPFTPEQADLLRRAIATADSIVTDPVFRSVARGMEEWGSVDWRENRGKLLPEEAVPGRTQWLLARFGKEGNYRMEDVHPRRARGTGTTAWTRACRPSSPTCRLETDVNLNVVYVDSGRTIYALANTLIHERVHSFGQVHGASQYRADNVCDVAYVLGDMAEALLRHRAERAPIRPREDLCPALHERLEARGIVLPRAAASETG